MARQKIKTTIETIETTGFALKQIVTKFISVFHPNWLIIRKFYLNLH